MGYTDFRSISPSIAFLFARLGGLLDSSGDIRYPQIGDFAVGDSGLNLALGDLYPLLHRSLSWFKSIHGVLSGKYGIGVGNEWSREAFVFRCGRKRGC